MDISMKNSDRIPQKARDILYAVFVVAMIATPFVNILSPEAIAQAFVASTSIVGVFAGATALTHPTNRVKGDDVE